MLRDFCDARLAYQGYLSKKKHEQKNGLDFHRIFQCSRGLLFLWVAHISQPRPKNKKPCAHLYSTANPLYALEALTQMIIG